MTFKAYLLGLCVINSLPSFAQEFWLQPSCFRCRPGEEVNIGFVMGEGFVGEFWDRKKYDMNILQWYSFGRRQDFALQSMEMKLGRQVKLDREGTHLFALETDTELRTWKADQFGKYLDDNGLNDITEHRIKSNTSDQSVKENCTRYGKVLIQAGAQTDDTFSKSAGLRVEIIPQKNPYALKTGDYLQCLVLFDGKPSPHILVKVWSHLKITTFLQNLYSMDDGTITFPISVPGAWMLSTVKMIPSEKPGADWHSLAGSLVFAIN